MNGQQYVRAFIAIELPGAVRRGLWEIGRSLQSGPIRTIKWVPESNMHLTLKFLGDVPVSQIPEITSTMQNVASSIRPLNLHVTGPGAFPGPSRPRVIWAGLGGDTETLVLLATAIDAALSELGYPRETRPFTPHLTLARVRPEAPAIETRNLGERLQSARLPGKLEFVADGLTLMKSVLRPEGASYFRLSTADFHS